MTFHSEAVIDAPSFIEALKAIQIRKATGFDWYKPYPVFQEFHRLGKHARIRLLMAANRIGKTHSCLAEFAQHVTANYAESWDGHRIRKKNITAWLGCLTATEAKDMEARLFEGLGDIPPFIHPSLVVSVNRQYRTYTIRNGNGGLTRLSVKTYGGGASRANESSTWKAMAVDVIFLDEQPPWHVYSECCMRIAKVTEDQEDRPMMFIAATCLAYTPFVLSFTEKVEESEGRVRTSGVAPGEIVNDCCYLTAGLDCAAHLSDEERHNMIARMHPNERQARSTGIPSVGSGLVFPVLQEAVTYDDFEIPVHWPRIHGMDFGWKDHTVVMFGALDRDTGTLYVYNEYRANEKTPREHIEAMQKMPGSESLQWAYVCGDPAGQARGQKDGVNLFSMYRNNGVMPFFLVKANNERSSMIQKMLQMMMDGKLKISRHKCQGLLRELKTYAYNDQGMIKDGDDHSIDATRYMVAGLSRARTLAEHQAASQYSEHQECGMI